MPLGAIRMLQKLWKKKKVYKSQPRTVQPPTNVAELIGRTVYFAIYDDGGGFNGPIGPYIIKFVDALNGYVYFDRELSGDINRDSLMILQETPQ